MISQTKTLLFVCFLVPLILAARCEDSFGTKTLKQKGWQEAAALAATSDGGAIVVGQSDTGDNNHDIYILKLNSTGDIQWSKSFGGDLEDTALTVFKTEDGAYLVAGYVYEGNTTVPVTLFKIDEQGSLLWKKQHALEDVHLSAVIPEEDGGFVLAGTYRKFNDDQEDEEGFALISLDSQGEKKWHNVVLLDGPRAFIKSIAQTEDGGFVLSGTKYDFGAYDHQVMFYKTDSFGDLLWSQEYGHEGVAEEIMSLASTDDGGFVAAGSRGIDYLGTPPAPQISKNALVIKYDNSGRLEWDKMYGGDPEDSAHKIRTTTDGGYIFAGLTRSYGFQNNDAWVVKLNGNGDQEWHAFHPGDATIAEAVDVQEKEDGTFIATGKILNLIRNWDIFVWHLDVDGSF